MSSGTRVRKASRSDVQWMETEVKGDDEVDGYEKSSKVYYLLLGLVVVLMLGYAAYLLYERGNPLAGSDMMVGTEEGDPDVPPEPVPEPLPTEKLNVESEPAGAVVTVNGVLQEGTTPLDVEVVSGAINSIAVYSDGHYPAFTSLNLASGGAKPVKVTLKPLVDEKAAKTKRKPKKKKEGEEEESPYAIGTLTLASNPPGADVFLNGKKVGQTPATIEKVAANVPQQITLKKDGFLPIYMSRVVFQDVDNKLPEIGLVAADSEGAKRFMDVEIETIPRTATIYLAGSPVGGSPFFKNFGRHQVLQVEVKNKGYHPFKRSISTASGPVKLHAQLEKVVKKKGFLTVAVKPKDVMLILGPNQHEKLKKEEVDAGNHTLTMVKLDGTRGELELYVDPDSEAVYSIDFSGDEPKMSRKK